MSKELLQFDSLKADVSALVAPARAIKVTDFASSADAINAAKQVKELSNQIEKKRKELVGPLNDQVKAINDYAKQILFPLVDAEAHIKAELRDFEIEQERVRAESRRKAEEERIRKEAELRAKQDAERAEVEARLAEEARAADIFGGDESAPDLEAIHTAMEEKQLQEQAIFRSEVKAKEFDIDQQGIKGAAKVWKCEITDIDAIPKDYLIRTLNEKAVLAMARAGVTNIPGVRVWQDISVRIGAKTYVPRAALGSERK
jgi:hypothetical protein